jgi:hypothetical protein
MHEWGAREKKSGGEHRWPTDSVDLHSKLRMGMNDTFSLDSGFPSHNKNLGEKNLPPRKGLEEWENQWKLRGGAREENCYFAFLSLHYAESGN